MIRTFPFGLAALEPCTPGQPRVITAANLTGRTLEFDALLVPDHLAAAYDLSSLTIDGKEQLSGTVVPAALFAASARYRLQLKGDPIPPGATVQLVCNNRSPDPSLVYFQAALVVMCEGDAPVANLPVATPATAPPTSPAPPAVLAPVAPNAVPPAS